MRRNLRWRPDQVRAMKLFEDLNRYPIMFEIRGAHDDPEANAVPYERMTRRSKYKDPRALRYKAWKIYVLKCFSEQTRQAFPCEPDGQYRLDVKCFFVGENHADPENVRKGIQDALFAYGDKHVFGLIYPVKHVEENPRVEVIIDHVPEAKKMSGH